jgi:hypothetical protein
MHRLFKNSSIGLHKRFSNTGSGFEGENLEVVGESVRQSYSYPVPSPHRLFKNSSRGLHTQLQIRAQDSRERTWKWLERVERYCWRPTDPVVPAYASPRIQWVWSGYTIWGRSPLTNTKIGKKFTINNSNVLQCISCDSDGQTPWLDGRPSDIDNISDHWSKFRNIVNFRKKFRKGLNQNIDQFPTFVRNRQVIEIFCEKK